MDSADGYRWERARGGWVPARAVPHGYEENGEPIWVCRAVVRGALHPGKVRPAFGRAQVTSGGEEVGVDEYEVLMDRGVWGIACGGEVPDDAHPAGREPAGEAVYVARAAVGGSNLHIGKVRPGYGSAVIGYGDVERRVHAYEVLLNPDRPLEPAPEPPKSDELRFPPTYAVFAGGAPGADAEAAGGTDVVALVANAEVMVRGGVLAADHLKLTSGGAVDLYFEVPEVSGRHEATLHVRALVSMAGPDTGYAPMTVTVNGTPVVTRWRIPTGGGLPQDLVFAVPGEGLRHGVNHLSLSSGDDAVTMLWLYRIMLDPMCANGQSARAADVAAAGRSGRLRYTTRAGGDGTGWRTGPEVTVHVERGEQSALECVAWADRLGTEYAVTFTAELDAFYGWCRVDGGRPEEFRGRVARDAAEEVPARVFETSEGYGGGWFPSGRIAFAVGADPDPTRVSWRDRRGNNGTVAFGPDGGDFTGIYQRVGEGAIGYRGRAVQA